MINIRKRRIKKVVIYIGASSKLIDKQKRHSEKIVTILLS